MNKVIMSIILLVMFAGTASAGPVEDRINKINTWFANEKAETVEFQKVKCQNKAKTKLLIQLRKSKTYLIGVIIK